MIKIKEDESIHGYLARVLIIYGELHQIGDLAGIISSSGVIRELPKLNERKRKFFTELTVKDINHILENNIPYSYRDTGVLGFAADYIFEGVMHGPSQHKLNARTKFRYCIDCFREQIKNYGHSWFLLRWVYSIDCDIHKKRMSHLRAHTQECCGEIVNILDNLKSATSGKCFYCQSLNWEFSKEIYLGDWNKEYYYIL